MASVTSNFAPVRFSTADIPERDRVAVWREVIGRKIVRVDIEPLRDRPFHVDASLRVLPGLGIMSARMSAFRLARTPELVADGNADLRLAVNISGAETVVQRGREVTLGAGDAILVSMAETGSIVRPAPGRRFGFNIPRSVLAPLVTNVEAARMRWIPRETPALRLLMGYVGVLQDEDALATPELRRLVVSHIHDLAALVIGATRDAEAVAQGRGARAARLRAIMVDIAENLGRSDLSIDVVARRHQLGTPIFKGYSKPTERPFQNSSSDNASRGRAACCQIRVWRIGRSATSPAIAGFPIRRISAGASANSLAPRRPTFGPETAAIATDRTADAAAENCRCRPSSCRRHPNPSGPTPVR